MDVLPYKKSDFCESHLKCRSPNLYGRALLRTNVTVAAMSIRRSPNLYGRALLPAQPRVYASD